MNLRPFRDIRVGIRPPKRVWILLSVAAFLFFFTLLPLSSTSIRSITTVESELYSFDDHTWDIEEVGIFSVTEQLSIVGKVQWYQETWKQGVKGMAGVVFPVIPSSYMETSYGLAFEDTGDIVHHALADFYYEHPAFLGLLSVRAQFSDNGQVYMPSVGIKWYTTDRLSLWGKYTTSIDTVIGFDHSFWGEAEYKILDPLLLKAGGTIGSYHADESSPQELEYSFLGGLGFLPMEMIKLSYQFEYTIRQQYGIISNALILDARL
ncbi:MAG: hypothetical protein K9L68_00310 [Spirochaetales bacterium]|nr:hypothetical protein [Spirochaetales bacterium]MCF7937019.1 hypothetical protein [Spirochaetales bacterium]